MLGQKFANFYIAPKNMDLPNEPQVLGKSYPERRRKVSNIIPLCLFVIATCVLVVVSVFAFQTCMPSRFYRGLDSWGNVCGGDPNTLTSVANLEGSGQLKAESKYVWQINLPGYVPNTTKGEQNNCSTAFASLQETTSVNICTKVCPNSSLILSNATNYRSILQGNGYQQRHAAAYTVATKLKKVDRFCGILSNSSDLSFVDILGRCLPGRLLSNGYVLIPNYLSIWHYVVNDIFVCGSAISGSVIAVMGVSVLVSIFSIKWPKHATTGCFLGSTGGSLLVAAFNTWKVYSHRNESTNVLVVNDSKFLCILLSAVTVLLAVVALQKWWLYRRYSFGARGLMVEMSRCLHSLPKLLSVPLCTLFVAVLCSIYFLSVGLYLLNCHSLKVAESGLVEYVTQSITISEVIGLIGTITVYIWFLNILKTGQQVTVAGAVAQWYFAKKKNRVLHPITSSLRLFLQYNMGSVVTCAFNSWFLRTICLRKGKSNKIDSTNDEIIVNDQQVASTWKCCLSPYAHASLGVYGYLRTTCLCNFRDDLSWNRRCTINQQFTNQKLQSSHALRFVEEGLVHVLRSSTYAARSSIQILSSCLVCVTLSIFLAISMHTPLYVKLFPFATTLFISYMVCDICLNVMVTVLDTISICFFEDVTRNDGVTTPLYTSRGLVYHITGLRLPETSTFASILRRKRKEMKLESQMQKELEERQREQETFERIRMRPRNVQMRNQRLQLPKRVGTPLGGQKRTKKATKRRELPGHVMREKHGHANAGPSTKAKKSSRVGSVQTPSMRHQSTFGNLQWRLVKPISRVSRAVGPKQAENRTPTRVIPTVRHHDDEEIDSDEADDETYLAKIWREGFW